MSDSICSRCYERRSNIAKNSNITRPWLLNTKSACSCHQSIESATLIRHLINGSASGVLSMQLGLSGKLGKLLNTRLTQG
jgi:hypothetical protein